ncbi:POLG1X [Auxenochlorella protothecoides x Auxenochlorella symbiontica]
MTTPVGTTAELATPPAEPEAAGPKVLGMSEVAGAGFLAAQREFHERCPNTPPPHVLVVNTLAGAQAAAARLLSPELRGRVFACDTEVSAIDVTSQSPCCHGDLICFSIHCGPDVDFGGGASPSVQSTLWVDTYLDGDASRKEEAAEILSLFAPFFSSPDHPKVWHNFSFDRHIVERAGVKHAGFEADTMHMARLWDSSRSGKLTYSLESLSSDVALMGSSAVPKIGMKDLFARPNKRADGTNGKLLVMDAVEELQRGEDTRWRWVAYSATDARATWDLYAALRERLEAMTDVALDPGVAAEYAAAGRPIASMWDVYLRFWRPFGELLTEMEALGVGVDRAHLAAAERRAVADQERARAAFRDWAVARVPGAAHMNVGSGAQVAQLLFAGVPNGRDPAKAGVPLSREFKVPNTLGVAEGGKKAKKNIAVTLHGLWGEGVASPLVPTVHTPSGAPACNTAVLKALAGPPGRAAKALAALEHRPGAGLGLGDSLDPVGAWDDASGVEAGAMGDSESTADLDADGGAGAAADASANPAGAVAAEPLDAADLEAKRAAGGHGALFPLFGSELEGLRACAAVDALVDVGAIDTLLSNFIVPLQQDAIAKPAAVDWAARRRGEAGVLGARNLSLAGREGPTMGQGSGGGLQAPAALHDSTVDGPPPAPAAAYRVHCSLNINTETGRLSARRPNLQNQPALEKDRYGVRRAFTADLAAGHTLVVADYGQLELRILAHMANCRSMIEAFEAGGDFHSRTALGMYDHIKAAVASGECLLEWDGGPDGASPPPVPLLKDLFSSERRRAKVLNFSIAYGKTAHGLSKDWGVSLEEARETVERWYADRPEVRAWQKAQQAAAQGAGYVCTLLGRRRQLPEAASRNGAVRAHALRAAINTPIQGSAADVATAAMLRIAADPELRRLGWALLLQVHDEVILEGPRESAEEARRRVVACMRSPFVGKVERPLLVDLAVDAKYADTWYDAK